MPSELKALAWDIETAPNEAYVWGLWDQNVGLNQLIRPGRVMSFSARWLDQPKESIVFHSDFHDGHEGMVEAAWELIDEADALVSWNGKGFDSKHIRREFLLQGLTPPTPVIEIDLMLTARKVFKFPSNKLEYVATELGFGGKVKHSGFSLWERCLKGEPEAWEEMKVYNEQDVHLLVDLHDRLLPWITPYPNVNLFEGLGCSRCGSSDLVKWGTRLTNLGRYQRYRCRDCGSYTSDGKSLIRVEKRSA